MRKLKLQMQLSVDGYVAGPNGELDWMNFDQDSKLLALINSLTDSSDTILLGRKMTDGFVTYWENVVNNQPDSPEFSFAQKMVDTPKVVFSKTLKSIAGKNVTIENGDLATAVKNMKSKTGKDIIVYGGAGFVSSLIKEGLIDEFNFFVNPIMINKGLRIFDLLGERQKLLLQNATGFECGVAVLIYKLNNPQ
ncbi:dihydrofolate reductase family protein [Spirosoma aureum]|uniref:Dihydrofolate reductase family protein n=1 Tax=Spirosoma aureum TaxID=2692134 RepID=A0A6G9AS67_9BACT|nr:dihydrofolate reductase family protein [Spirosoma aureum]QIP15317.1 dihydrofolate reductase family protein [Spirosoma aureum]